MKEFLEDLNKYWATPIIAVVGGLLGLYFTVIKDNLEVKAKKIENSALRIETELREREFSNTLKIQMYKEVKEAISKKDQKLQNAVLLLVNEMLADDSLFKDKLITVLLASPNTDAVVKEEQEKFETKKSEYLDQEATKIVQGRGTVDVFYLEDIIAEAKPRAQKIVDRLQKQYPNFRIRMRLLPRTVNARRGYRIGENQIRYESIEEDLALNIATLVKNEKIFSIGTTTTEEDQPKDIYSKLCQHFRPKYVSSGSLIAADHHAPDALRAGGPNDGTIKSKS